MGTVSVNKYIRNEIKKRGGVCNIRALTKTVKKEFRSYLTIYLSSKYLGEYINEDDISFCDKYEMNEFARLIYDLKYKYNYLFHIYDDKYRYHDPYHFYIGFETCIRIDFNPEDAIVNERQFYVVVSRSITKLFRRIIKTNLDDYNYRRLFHIKTALEKYKHSRLYEPKLIGLIVRF